MGARAREGHSPATVHKIHRVLSLVLDMAVKDGRLARNVANGVNLPRVGKHEHRYLTDEQVDDLATAAGYPADASKYSSLDTRTNETYRLVVLFLAYTGVRFGEMAALRVARLDLRRSRAVIVESVTPVQGQGLVWGTTKTHQRREVPISRFLAAELAEHINGKQPDDLVFAGIRNGQPLRVSTFRTAFSAAARTIGVPDLHPHQMDAARAAARQRRNALRALPRVAPVPEADSTGNAEGPLPAFPLVRPPFRTGTSTGFEPALPP